MKDSEKKFNTFSAATEQDWETAAKEELDGANPWEKLAFRGDGWSIHPFYDQSKAIRNTPLLPVPENDVLGARAWFNCPQIAVSDAKSANALALQHLKTGADGILFELPEQIDFNLLLQGIEWGYCSLNFLARKNPKPLAEGLHRFIKEKKLRESDLHGAFFGNESISLTLEGPFCFTGFELTSNSSPVKEIISGFEVLKKSGIPSGPVAFRTALGTDFFPEIAKLRALRTVWNNLVRSGRIAAHAPLQIHAVSPAWVEKSFQPHGNMIKSTTAAMAAVLGGCDILTVNGEDPGQSMMSRVARNISNILREESHLSKVADPVAGSYFIEDLTDQFSSSAWKSVEPMWHT